MKPFCIVIMMCLALCIAAQAICQEGRREIPHVQDRGARGRTWEHEVAQDGMDTSAKRPALPTRAGMQDRLALVQEQIRKLESEKALAVEQGRTAEDIAAIDARIGELRRLAVVLELELGRPGLSGQPQEESKAGLVPGGETVP